MSNPEYGRKGLKANAGLPSSRPAPCRPLRRLAAPLLVTLLAACSALPEPPPAAALYDFGPNTARAPAADPARAQRPLMLDKVAADSLPDDQQALLYRYAYADDHQLRAYQRARWAQPVDQLLAQQLRRQLQGHWAVLTSDHDRARVQSGANAPLVLYVALERFEQVFTGAEESAGVVELRVTVLRGDGGRLLAQRGFQSSVDAPSADAPGGARALAIAARQVSADIDQWLRSLAP